MNATHQRELLQTLATRFAKHPRRHEGIAWADIAARLEAHPAALRALAAM